MTIGDSRCDTCGSTERWPFVGTVAGHRLCLCRVCIGKAVHAFLRYIRGFDRDHPTEKPPRNQGKPRRDPFGHYRCRDCSVQLPDWKPGQPPRCAPCGARISTAHQARTATQEAPGLSSPPVSRDSLHSGGSLFHSDEVGGGSIAKGGHEVAVGPDGLRLDPTGRDR